VLKLGKYYKIFGFILKIKLQQYQKREVFGSKRSFEKLKILKLSSNFSSEERRNVHTRLVSKLLSST
jgi:hypothetical protein